MSYFYVYILQTNATPRQYYTGFTENLESRLEAHNEGRVQHTSRFRPWRIKTAIACTDKQRALDFETYLKSGSGRAFSKKHL
ncbi:MAG: GIY-YIG nuclease family protein [Acidobacteria bacterium]|nr:MAG: GIY-YIG nuclease family protein [Acidobacteriota bacterium]